MEEQFIEGLGLAGRPGHSLKQSRADPAVPAQAKAELQGQRARWT